MACMMWRVCSTCSIRIRLTLRSCWTRPSEEGLPSCSSDTRKLDTPPSKSLTTEPRPSPALPWLASMPTASTPGAWPRTFPSAHAMSGAGLTSRQTMVPWRTAMDRVTAGPPSNGWPTKQMFVGWQVCCFQAMDLRCDWACDTCPWMAITRTLTPCSSSMAVCIKATIVASFRTHDLALLPRRDGSPLKRTRTTWGPPVATHSSPSGSASGKTSSIFTLTRLRSVKAKKARARNRHCQAPVCQTPWLTLNRLWRPYIRTASSVWPRWTSKHLRTWRTSFVTYHLSSRVPCCLERMPAHIWPSSVRLPVSAGPGCTWLVVISPAGCWSQRPCCDDICSTGSWSHSCNLYAVQ